MLRLKNTASKTRLYLFMGVASVSAAATVTHPSSDARSATRPEPYALEAQTAPRQGYRAARGCRGLPGSEATQNCIMLA
ncbi:MAG: hypothetical protein ACO3P1_10040 [Pseudomonadales bacterium]